LKEKILSLYKAFADYFGDIDSIEQYMREEKLKSVAEFHLLVPAEDDLFSDFSMHQKIWILKW
jgi:hypothetical protein